MKRLWRIWKYALGSFADEKTKRYDNIVVIIRSFILLTYVTTNCFIIAGVIRHWNSNQETVTLSPYNLEQAAIINAYRESYDSKHRSQRNSR